MNYLDHIAEQLARESSWRYGPRSAPAAEPTALAAIALSAHGREDDGRRARVWLARAQNTDGSVGVRMGAATPGWPTPLAVLAWTLRSTHHSPTTNATEFDACRQRAIDWLLATRGETSPPQEYTGHDTSLSGWPWVVGTHSWVEPTAHAVLALRAVGLGEHARVQEAVRLLHDRLLESGGCNYGNTVVLGQQLLPHILPTGVALVALRGTGPITPRVAAAGEYLAAELGPTTAPASLAWGLLGLAAVDRWPAAANGWLATAAARALRRGALHELALLALAGLREDSPLISLQAAAGLQQIEGRS